MHVNATHGHHLRVPLSNCHIPGKRFCLFPFIKMPSKRLLFLNTYKINLLKCKLPRLVFRFFISFFTIFLYVRGLSWNVKYNSCFTTLLSKPGYGSIEVILLTQTSFPLNLINSRINPLLQTERVLVTDTCNDVIKFLILHNLQFR